MLNKKSIGSKKGRLFYTQFLFELPKIETGNYLISPAVADGTQETHTMLTWINSAISTSCRAPWL